MLPPCSMTDKSSLSKIPGQEMGRTGKQICKTTALRLGAVANGMCHVSDASHMYYRCPDCLTATGCASFEFYSLRVFPQQAHHRHPACLGLALGRLCIRPAFRRARWKVHFQNVPLFHVQLVLLTCPKDLEIKSDQLLGPLLKVGTKMRKPKGQKVGFGQVS